MTRRLDSQARCRPRQHRRLARCYSVQRGHRGAVLVVGLLILLVLTVLGLSSMRTSVLQELMAGHAKDSNTAFHAAEGAMQAGLTYLASRRAGPPVLKARGSTVTWTGNPVWPACEVGDPDPKGTPTSFDPCSTIDTVIAGWRAYGKGEGKSLAGQVINSVSGSGLSGIGTAEQPRYVIESRYIPLDYGAGEWETQAQRKGYHYSTVTSVGFDANTRSRVILRTSITQIYQ